MFKGEKQFSRTGLSQLYLPNWLWRKTTHGDVESFITCSESNHFPDFSQKVKTILSIFFCYRMEEISSTCNYCAGVNMLKDELSFRWVLKTGGGVRNWTAEKHQCAVLVKQKKKAQLCNSW